MDIGHTHTHTTILLLVWNMSGSTRVSRYQKGKTKKVKTNLDLLEPWTLDMFQYKSRSKYLLREWQHKQQTGDESLNIQ